MSQSQTSVDETFQEPAPERVGSERGSLTRIVQELVFTVDHKKLGLMYIGSGLLFFVVAGVMATLRLINIQLHELQ